MQNCSVDGCGNFVKAKGLCVTHYHRNRNRGTPTPRDVRRYMPDASTEEKLTARTEKGPECWIFQGGKSPYGVIPKPGGYVYAHRAAYILAYGEIPAGLYVCHKCDTPRCVNPDHLFLGTCSENLKDMHAKGRATKAHAIGEDVGNAVLSSELVQRIRSSDSRVVDLARELGISRTAVHQAQSGKTWGHVAPTQNDLTVTGTGRQKGSRGADYGVLTDEQVFEIRASSERDAQLAKRFGISRCSISGIRTRRYWAHLAPRADELPPMGQVKGETNPAAKLNEDTVRLIRASSEKGTVLAARFNISTTVISDIRNRKIWKHVED